MKPPRPPTPPEALQRCVMESPTRAAAVLALAHVAALALDYVVEDRARVQIALDIARSWCTEGADSEGVRAARETLVLAATRSYERGERAPWFAMQAVVSLVDVLLEPGWELAGKRARDLGHYLEDAMSWPDLDDLEVCASARRTLAERMVGM